MLRRRAEAMKGPIEEWLDGIDPECERGPDIMSLRRVRDSCWWMIEVKQVELHGGSAGVATGIVRNLNYHL